MKLRNLKKLDKEFIYDAYFAIVDEPLPYQKITREKMLTEIIQVYQFPERILKCVSLNEIKLLQKITTSSQYKYTKNDDLVLTDKLLVILTQDYQAHIPEELEHSIKEAIKLADRKQLRALDELNNLLKGLLMIYGIIEFDELLMIINHYKLSFDLEFIRNYILTNPQPRFYSRFSKNKIAYLDYINEGLISHIEKNRNHYAITDYKIYCKKDILDIVDYNFNQAEYQKFKKLFKLNKDESLKRQFFYNVFSYLSVIYPPDNVFNFFLSTPDYDSYDLRNYKNEFYLLYHALPSPSLNGYSISDISSKNEITSKKTKSNNKLSAEDADLFFKLYFALIEYVNMKLKISKQKKFFQVNNISPDIDNIREALFNEHLELIDEFVIKNPYYFTTDELLLIRKFKDALIGTFYIINSNKNGTIVADENLNTYLIKGLVTDISDLCDSGDVVRLVLLPFKKQLVYDGAIAKLPLKLHTTLKKALIANTNDKTLLTQLSKH